MERIIEVYKNVGIEAAFILYKYERKTKFSIEAFESSLIKYINTLNN